MRNENLLSNPPSAEHCVQVQLQRVHVTRYTRRQVYNGFDGVYLAGLFSHRQVYTFHRWMQKPAGFHMTLWTHSLLLWPLVLKCFSTIFPTVWFLAMVLNVVSYNNPTRARIVWFLLLLSLSQIELIELPLLNAVSKRNNRNSKKQNHR